MIEVLTFQNLKGATRTLTLPPLAVLTGENHAGKTAVFDAITVGLLGYHPRLGKTNPATFKLASGPEMFIAMSGRRAGKTWNLERNWKLAGKTIKATTAGEGPYANLAAIDPEAFIGAAPKARLEMLALLAPTEAMEELKSKCLAWETPGLPPQADPLAWAEELEATAKADAKSSRELIDRFTKTIQGLADIALPTEEETVTTAQQWETANAETFAAHTAKVAADAAVADIWHAIEAAEDAPELCPFPEPPDMPALEVLQDAATAAGDALLVATNAHNAAKDAMNAIKAIRAQYPGLEDHEIAALISEIADAEIIALRAKPERTAEIKATWDHVSETLLQEKANLRDAVKAQEEADKAIEELNHLETCPVCKASAFGWKTGALEYYRHQKDQAAQAIQTATTAVRMLSDTLITESAELDNARLEEKIAGDLPRKREFLEAARVFQGMTDDVLKAEAHALETRRAGDRALAAYAAAQVMRNEAKDVWSRYERDVAEATKRNAEAQNRPARPTKETVDAAHEAAHAAAAAFDASVERIKALQAKLETFAEARRQRKIEEESAAQIEQETARLAEHTERAKAIRAAREEAILGAYQPIIAAAAQFAEGVMDGTLEVNDGDLGCARNGLFVPFPILSGTEKAVITAAIQAGLGGIVMIDEASRMTRPLRERFAANLEAAIADGRIDQAILIDHDRDAWPTANLVDIS